MFALAVAWISFAVFLYRQSYMMLDKHLPRFSGILLAFVLSMFLLIFRPNLFTVIIGWDGLGVTSFLLVIYFQNLNSLNAGLITLLTNRLGDVLIITSMALLLARGTWAVGGGGLLPTPVAHILLVAAFTKRAQLPFSSWLPAAMAAPTPVSALVHSSTLVTAGIYLVLRFKGGLLVDASAQQLCLFTGAGTIVVAGVRGLYEDDFKKLVALSTLSQLGLIVTSLGLLRFEIVFFHLLTHAFFKALLFLGTGSIIHSSANTQDLHAISLPWQASPLTSSVVLVSNLSLIGLPFTSGFYSKDMALELGLSSSLGFLRFALLFIGTALTALYSVRFMLLSLAAPAKAPALH